MKASNPLLGGDATPIYHTEKTSNRGRLLQHIGVLGSTSSFAEKLRAKYYEQTLENAKGQQEGGAVRIGLSGVKRLPFDDSSPLADNCPLVIAVTTKSLKH